MHQFRKVTQITDSHCGPAVLEMLLDAVGVQTSQSAITRAAGIERVIQERGARIDQLALACSKIAPDMAFWYKYHASLDDILHVLDRGYIVAVEWQGIFYQSLSEQEKHDDNDTGHYSIITHYDPLRQSLIIVDPYKEFVNQDRILDVPTFLNRWWDVNEIELDNDDDEDDEGEIITRKDEQLLFFVTPDSELFSYENGFKQYVSIED